MHGGGGKARAAGDWVQPVSAGFLAAVVGFASSFAIVLQGLVGVGATPRQAASGLLALCVIKGCLGIALSVRTRQPISIAWSTPGAALLLATGTPQGGFATAVGAFLFCAMLLLLAGLWRPFGRAVLAIPMTIASAMLAGVLLELCLAPMKALSSLPLLTLPIIVVWMLALRFARMLAVPLAVLVTALVVVFATPLPTTLSTDLLPQPLFVAPHFSLASCVSLGLPLFLVTMASQNVPGLAVLRVNGYRPDLGPILVATGLASSLIALFGGHAINLAAITAALCAGPEAHPDPARRYLAAATAGATYVGLGLSAGFASAFIAASPPLLVEAVAGLALLGSLANALASALAKDEDRLPAIVTFATTASGVAFFSIGAAFWGLVAGLGLLFVQQWGLKDNQASLGR
jgi:benzoate membrane transport protein